MRAISQREPPLIAAGTQVDHFRVMRLLGQGGMAQVYLARDTKLGRKVALKVIRPVALGSQDSIARFLFEARATARFNHPHIVTIFAVGEYEGRPYVALEYLEGQTLKERLEEGAPSVREALRITIAIAEALSEAHRSQILHRDLKPENVVIPRDGRLRVVDFGLAKSLDATSDASTSEGLGTLQSVEDLEQTVTQDVFETNERGLRGTPQYMSPEQWMGLECSAATDVWALGLICYEMLAGRLPYSSPTAMTLAVKVCDPDPVTELKSVAEVTDEVSDLAARCLRKDPKERPSIDEVVELLEEMLEVRPEKILVHEVTFSRALAILGTPRRFLFWQGRRESTPSSSGSAMNRSSPSSVPPGLGRAPSSRPASSLVSASRVDGSSSGYVPDPTRSVACRQSSNSASRRSKIERSPPSRPQTPRGHRLRDSSDGRKKKRSFGGSFSLRQRCSICTYSGSRHRTNRRCSSSSTSSRSSTPSSTTTTSGAPSCKRSAPQPMIRKSQSE